MKISSSSRSKCSFSEPELFPNFFFSSRAPLFKMESKIDTGGSSKCRVSSRFHFWLGSFWLSHRLVLFFFQNIFEGNRKDGDAAYNSQQWPIKLLALSVSLNYFQNGFLKYGFFFLKTKDLRNVEEETFTLPRNSSREQTPQWPRWSSLFF